MLCLSSMCCVIFVSIFVSSINVRFPRVAERSCANLLNPRTGDTVPHHLYTCELRIMLSVISCYLCCESATQAGEAAGPNTRIRFQPSKASRRTQIR